MVDSIGGNDSLYGTIGIGAYSIGTYSQVEKTDTEVFEDVFQDALEAVDDKTQEQTISKIDESSLGIPAGMEIEGVQNVEEVAQSDASQSGGGGSSSEDDEEDYDEMDLNQDGTVTPVEMIIYEMTQGMSQSEGAASSVDSATLSDALSAYMVA